MESGGARIQVSDSVRGATNVDRVLGVSEIKLLNRKLNKLVKIFTKQK